jgi:hypothetical protein
MVVSHQHSRATRGNSEIVGNRAVTRWQQTRRLGCNGWGNIHSGPHKSGISQDVRGKHKQCWPRRPLRRCDQRCWNRLLRSVLARNQWRQRLFKLDPNTGKISGYGIDGPGLATDPYLRTIISSDNSRVFFNDDGFVFYINTATDKWVPASLDQTCCYGDYELALSANQARFEASGYFYDSNLPNPIIRSMTAKF